jgi:hypothetical protein
MVARAWNPSYSGGRGRKMEVPGQKYTPQLQNKTRRAEAMAQVVECKPSKHKAEFKPQYLPLPAKW